MFVLVEKLGFKFWKDIHPDKALEQVIKCTKPIKSSEEWMEYACEIMQEYMDFSRPLWEFHLVEDFSEDLSAVIVRMHHSFTDGIGFVSMMSWLNDDQFKFKIDKRFKEPSIFQKLIVLLLTPYYIIKWIAKN